MADTQPAPAPATIEINDALFCPHFKEVCGECAFDGREENDAFFGFDPIEREALLAPAAIVNKDGVYQCKKHAATGEWFALSAPGRPSAPFVLRVCIPLVTVPPLRCTQCYGWKKQITRARAAAKKAGRK
ncbi:hypothetical protein B0H15DRAFT_790275 [Mycena belliarum]|uniref:Uncharacterized protein n=1 Tax=Mycena belliarum TaxID=1033014 RepID=A0AAD6TVF0_9AGAR|nr:hypothetical protein B0H15DRAFT_790275 [Mycena belliae]